MRFTKTFVLLLSVGCSQPALAEQPKEITNGIGMKLVLIPKGTFTMGSPLGVAERQDDEAQHQVTISREFFLGVTEVTQGQYEKVMGTNPSYFQGQRIGNADSSKYPVEQVSWEDAVAFCKRLSELPEEKKAGRVYGLPTDAEWEYACRAGSKTAYSFGDSAEQLGDYAWFVDNARGPTHPVSQKKPNAWGLYDMHGNVWEWCADWSGDYPEGAVIDPRGPQTGSSRVFRGGGWDFPASVCRSAYRSRDQPVNRSYYLGFRVAAVPSASSASPADQASGAKRGGD